MDILSNFGETLKELISMRNINTVELEAQTNIDCTSYSKYLNKKVIPTLPNAITIADFFGCSLDYLFGLTNEFEKENYLPYQPFSKSFQEILKSHKCTRYRISKDLGIHNNTVTDWFYGRRIPTIDNLIITAKYLGCSLDELVGRKPVEKI
ncbi:MAG: helix-turn-helix domain-containing protein [Clostridia bacterium]|nr:helix-turn-helix domain-containing protein [Clostridia bacterium]